MSNSNTFERAGKENVIVSIIVYKFLYFPASLTTLVTRSTLKTLAITGPFFKKDKESAGRISIAKSNNEATTTKKSNLCQLLSKYERPNAINLSVASIIKTPVKI